MYDSRLSNNGTFYVFVKKLLLSGSKDWFIEKVARHSSRGWAKKKYTNVFKSVRPECFKAIKQVVYH